MAERIVSWGAAQPSAGAVIDVTPEDEETSPALAEKVNAVSAKSPSKSRSTGRGHRWRCKPTPTGLDAMEKKEGPSAAWKACFAHRLRSAQDGAKRAGEGGPETFVISWGVRRCPGRITFKRKPLYVRMRLPRRRAETLLQSRHPRVRSGLSFSPHR
jgi:hypothetical protein